ncbi:hypothetical protein YerA41_067 [Yersinia phage YerA41]|uniref:Uncharacterized protein n=1 Tax=Yersinia phage vB_Yru_GN1 TaxID=3074381 RepID=A0AA86JCU4_9CAUD|nr:hypothetical protein YerA41_067 [Yersinia phage YerA41]BES79879.1 hypothetical protein [Yersinia phage vB_Yru_GN1]
MKRINLTKDALKFINSQPKLLSILYDINLMPEQVVLDKTDVSKKCLVAAILMYVALEGLSDQIQFPLTEEIDQNDDKENK